MLSVQMLNFNEGFLRVEEKPVFCGENFQILSIKTDVVNKATGKLYTHLKIVETDEVGRFDSGFCDINNPSDISYIGGVLITDNYGNPYKLKTTNVE